MVSEAIVSELEKGQDLQEPGACEIYHKVSGRQDNEEFAESAPDFRYSARAFDAGIGTADHTLLRMTSGVKDLKLWQEAVALGGDVLRLARNTARRETKAYNDELIRSALAVGMAIADGYGHYETLEQRGAYRAARRHLALLETQLAVGRQGGVIPAGSLAPLSTRQASVNRLLSGYLAYVERQVEAERQAEGAPTASATSQALAIPRELSI